MIIWDPTFTDLASVDQTLDFAFVPFVKHSALEELASRVELSEGFSLIVSWKPDDIRSGVSDLSVYEFAKERGFKLYRSKDLHLKLFIYPDNQAFLTSGNLTGRGLGEQELRNLEIGVRVSLGPRDWSQVNKIIEDSVEVTQDMVDWFEEHASPEKSSSTFPPEPDWGKAGGFAITDFPATQSPDEFYRLYQMTTSELRASESRDFGQDSMTFRVPSGLSKEELWKRLASSLRSQSYVRHLLDWVKDEETLRFGTITQWVHTHCEDRPVPNRKEIKTYLNHLYDWMDVLLDEVSWFVPGERSQVLRWNNNSE
tara:strand:+ start:2501 stop:3436 length:936 start_codon:yes stop_codon:yes gene_type:complete